MQTAVRSWQPECDDVCSMGFSLLSWEAAWAVQSVRGRKQPFGSVAGSPNLARQARVSENTKLGVLVCRMCRRVQCKCDCTAPRSPDHPRPPLVEILRSSAQRPSATLCSAQTPCAALAHPCAGFWFNSWRCRVVAAKVRAINEEKGSVVIALSDLSVVRSKVSGNVNVLMSKGKQMEQRR